METPIKTVTELKTATELKKALDLICEGTPFEVVPRGTATAVLEHVGEFTDMAQETVERSDVRSARLLLEFERLAHRYHQGHAGLWPFSTCANETCALNRNALANARDV